MIVVVLAIRLLVQRAAAQRAAHDARLRSMAQVYLAAAKKKQAAERAAAAKAAESAAAESAGLAPPVTPATPIREERECPFCAELILKKAKVCKHCGREV